MQLEAEKCRVLNFNFFTYTLPTRRLFRKVLCIWKMISLSSGAHLPWEWLRLRATYASNAPLQLNKKNLNSPVKCLQIWNVSPDSSRLRLSMLESSISAHLSVEPAVAIPTLYVQTSNSSNIRRSNGNGIGNASSAMSARNHKPLFEAAKLLMEQRYAYYTRRAKRLYVHQRSTFFFRTTGITTTTTKNATLYLDVAKNHCSFLLADFSVCSLSLVCCSAHTLPTVQGSYNSSVSFLKIVAWQLLHGVAHAL